MTHAPSDALLRSILARPKTFAVVGASSNPARPSNQVARYLVRHGFRVIPVNPGLAGQSLWGEVVFRDLASIPDPVDVVDIFRRSEHVAPIVDQALARFQDLGAIWMQIGVVNEQAAARAEARGVRVVQNRCPRIEFARLYGVA